MYYKTQVMYKWIKTSKTDYFYQKSDFFTKNVNTMDFALFFRQEKSDLNCEYILFHET
jgi:hypothetical protein